MTSSTSEESPDPVIFAAGFIVFGLALLTGGGFLLWFSFLRETHSFWLNAGGYPIFLRDLVLIFYYPLLILSAIGTLTLTVMAFFKKCMPFGFMCLEGMFILGCWSLVIGSMKISLTNNIENLWNGRPLHYKPADTRH